MAHAQRSPDRLSDDFSGRGRHRLLGGRGVEEFVDVNADAQTRKPVRKVNGAVSYNVHRELATGMAIRTSPFSVPEM